MPQNPHAGERIDPSKLLPVRTVRVDEIVNATADLDAPIRPAVVLWLRGDADIEYGVEFTLDIADALADELHRVAGVVRTKWSEPPPPE